MINQIKNQLRKPLNTESVLQLKRMYYSLSIINRSDATIVNYIREVRFLLEFYNEPPQKISAEMVTEYLFDLKSKKAGYSKCKLAAHSIKYFFTYVLSQSYSIPKNIYPKPLFKLPKIMSVTQAKKLLSRTLGIRERCMISLLYGSGLRLSELKNLTVHDLFPSERRLKVQLGKGNKDRYTLLSPKQNQILRQYRIKYKPQLYLFETKPKRPLANRTIQIALRKAFINAGLPEYSSRTLRHSFATHLLDNRVDLFIIKELLGHSKIETTMTYLHLNQDRIRRIKSPLDFL